MFKAHSHAVPLENIRHSFGLDTVDQAGGMCRHYGLNVVDDQCAFDTKQRKVFPFAYSNRPCASYPNAHHDLCKGGAHGVYTPSSNGIVADKLHCQGRDRLTIVNPNHAAAGTGSGGDATQRAEAAAQARAKARADAEARAKARAAAAAQAKATADANAQAKAAADAREKAKAKAKAKADAKALADARAKAKADAMAAKEAVQAQVQARAQARADQAAREAAHETQAQLGREREAVMARKREAEDIEQYEEEERIRDQAEAARRADKETQVGNGKFCTGLIGSIRFGSGQLRCDVV
jgi:hypothetical protein